MHRRRSLEAKSQFQPIWCKVHFKKMEWSVKGEFRSLTVLGIKLLCSLVAVDTSVPFVRCQQGEQTLAVCVVF